MSKNTKGKVLMGGIIFIPIVIALLLITGSLEPQGEKQRPSPIELVDTGYDEVITPDGDGQADSMMLTATFKGKKGENVHVFLFISHGDNLIQFLPLLSHFTAGEYTRVNLNWDTRDWKGKAVGSGVFKLRLYYFNQPKLFDKAKKISPQKAYNLLTTAMAQPGANQSIKKWSGEVTVTAKPNKTGDSEEIFSPVIPMNKKEPIENATVITETNGSYDNSGIPRDEENRGKGNNPVEKNTSIIQCISITLTSPNGGETLTAGTTHQITWTSRDFQDNVRIEYSPDNGAAWLEITSVTSNDGVYDWEISAEPSNNCLIRISGTVNNVSDTSDSVFSIIAPVTPQITVNSPNGGEALPANSIHEITWSSSDYSGDVKIEYSMDTGGPWTTIANFTANDGSYHWSVPQMFSNKCLVRISASGNNQEPSDTSDAVFSIITPVVPVLNLTSPNGGETLTVGTLHYITWTGTGFTGDIAIEYSVNNGAAWALITPAANNPGSYSWVVPDQPSTGCLVRVRAADPDQGLEDTGDAVFSIITPQVPSLALIVPNGGEFLTIGSTFDITWTGTGITGNLKIEYSFNNGTLWQTVISTTENDGHYNWLVPDQPSGECLVRISALDMENPPSDTSNNVFTIGTGSGITLTSPNGGETWQVGNSYNITWTKNGSGVPNDLKILYSIDNGSSWLSITPSTENDGLYNWIVPDTPSTNSLVKIQAVDLDAGPSAVSASVFSIVSPLSPIIRVTSPNGGEQLTTGAIHNLTWINSGIEGNIKIDYSLTGGGTWIEITSSTVNDGSYLWEIPGTSSDTCLVRMSDISGEVADISDAEFSIAPPSTSVLTLTSPNGGETLFSGRSHEITWEYEGTAKREIKLEFSKDNGVTWNPIVSSTDNDGSYYWTVPNISSTDCLVRIGESDSDEGPSDIGDAVFSIEQNSTATTTVVFGRVFDAQNQNPLPDALITSSEEQIASNVEGNWKLTLPSGGTHKIAISKDGYTSVYRKIHLDPGKQDVVDDAYLTPLDTAVTPIGPAGGTHTDSSGTIEVVIPQGALAEIKEIRSTRLSSSQTLPGGLNETPDLEYPISYLFCADFGPDNTSFNQPVTIRVQNTWGFEPGTEIPYAYWDKETHQWIPYNGMAVVDAAGQWLEAQVTHFTPIDCNTPVTALVEDGKPASETDESEEEDDCIGSSVDINNGKLIDEFSVPGITHSLGSTEARFIYVSAAASPSAFVKITNYHDDNLVYRPDRLAVKIATPLLYDPNAGQPGMKIFHLNSPQKYGSGGVFLRGIYPGGEAVSTGYQDITVTHTAYYENSVYALVNNWGSIPVSRTEVVSPEPAYHTKEENLRVFMLSRVNSPFGRGWWLDDCEKLHFEGNRVVLIQANGDIMEFEKGINYADSNLNAVIHSYNNTFLNPASMLKPIISQKAQKLEPSQFEFLMAPPEGTDQTFIVDLGQERTLYAIGLDFPSYWQLACVWDYVKSSTSLDNQTWEEWHTSGIPTLKNAADGTDPLDFMIDTPLLIPKADKQVRYIKFQLGYPCVNVFERAGSRVNRVYAIGSETLYRQLNENEWPKLEYDSNTQTYILTHEQGNKEIFDSTGNLTARIDYQGKTITYEYNADKLSRILYPDNVYMEFFYDYNGYINKVLDSTGRETSISTDSRGNIVEVRYPDNSKREFGYDDRGLMIADKSGAAEKTYTWDDHYPLLTHIRLPNGGIRTVNSWMLNYMMNELSGTEENPANFPVDNTDGEVSISETVFEDGKTVKSVSGKGWKKRFVNNRLMDKTLYADAKKNDLPTLIETGDPAWEITDIEYYGSLAIKKYTTTVTDEYWLMGQGGQGAPYQPTGQTTARIAKQVEFAYNADNFITNVKEQFKEWNYTYDENKNLTRQEEKRIYYPYNSKFTDYTYNAGNELIEILYPDTRKIKMTYENGLVKETINNDNTKTVISRNNRGEIITLTDEENRSVSLTRDIMGRVVTETSPSGRVVRYEYGTGGCESCGVNSLLTKITDSGNNVWELKYDIMGNVTEMIYPDTTKLLQEYDLANRLVKFTNKRGQEITFDYDNDGKLIKKTLPEGQVDFTYDARDRISTIQAAHYHYRYSYGNVSGPPDNMTILQEENLAAGTWNQQITDYWGLPYVEVDNFEWYKEFIYGLKIGEYAPDYYSYRKKGITGELRTSLTYDNVYRQSSRINTKSQIESYYNYDTNGILSRYRYVHNSTTPIFPERIQDIQRDDSGIIASLTGPKQFSVTYNSDLEIESVQHSLPLPVTETYTYDTRGNRLTSPLNNYTYNELNRITDSTTHTYLYDQDGNLLEEKNKATTETKTYTYNSENRLSRYEHYPTDTSPADIIAEYQYDIQGRRIQKTVNGIRTNFTWIGDNIAMELDGTYQPIRKYFYGLEMDDVEAHLEYSEIFNWSSIFYFNYNDGWYFFLKDQAGTVTDVIDLKNRQFAEQRNYDSFGNLISQTGTSNCKMGFQGKYFDLESGMNYFYNRYYKPDLDRFLNEDPIGLDGGLNMYRFVANNPLEVTDPYGLDHEFLNPGEIEFFHGIGEGIYYFGKYYKDMKKANTIGADKYFHCLANCMASKAGPGGLAISALISELRELIDEKIKGDPPKACDEDRAANNLGRNASNDKSCKEVCKSLRPPKLDKKY